jgi:hypothetical protein
MIILVYIWILFLVMTTVFLLSAAIIEKNFDESHPVKKWWRRNVIGIYPEDVKNQNHDIQE